MKKLISSVRLLAGLMAGALGTVTFAQQQVNTQVNPQPANTQVNPAAPTPATPAQPAPVQTLPGGTQVNGELYGNTGPITPVRHYQSPLLPSDYRYIIERAGITPSELRTQADRVGGLAPDPLAYIPLQSALQRAIGMPQLQLYNPAYSSGPGAALPTPVLVNPITVPRSEPAPTNLLIPPQRIDAAVRVGTQTQTTDPVGTVYYQLPVRPPTTLPTTRPVLPTSPGEKP